MPVYEYECKKCGHRFELIQKVSDPPPAKCPKCKEGEIQKLLSAAGLQFKGSGWYVTDYSNKGKSHAEAGSKENPKSAEASKEGAKATPAPKEKGKGTESSKGTGSAPPKGSENK